MGMYLVEGSHGVAADVARGQPLLEGACAKDNLTACANIGLYYVQKKLTDPTNTKMAAALTKACDKGVATACNTLGYAMENGVGGYKPDSSKALSQYEKACGLGHGLACRNAAIFYAAGRGAPKDAAKSASFYEAGCKHADAESCAKTKRL